jgi:hypothetical protein
MRVHVHSDHQTKALASFRSTLTLFLKLHVQSEGKIEGKILILRTKT